MLAWIKKIPGLTKPFDNIGIWWAVFGPSGVLSVIMSWAASGFEPVARYGWGAIVFAGVGAACVIMIAVSVLLIGWRYFHPLARQIENEDLGQQASTGADTQELNDRISDLTTTMVNLAKDSDARISKLEEQIKSNKTSIENQIRLVSDRGHAQRAVYELLEYKREIERLIMLLDRPVKQPEGLRNWADWNTRFRKFETTLYNYMLTIEAYYPNDVPNIRIIPPETYRSDTGDFARELFPDHQTAHDFKTFRYHSSIYESVGDAYLKMIKSKVYG